MDAPPEVVNRITQALKKEGIYSPNVLAYALATIKAETGNFQPISEYGGKEQARRLGYSGGDKYYGRGYIQLTHDYNYKDIGRRIGLGDKLLQNPDLALDPEIAAKILAAFFKDKGVAKVAEKGDFVNARKPVNGSDRAGEIAGYAQNYLQQLPQQTTQKSQNNAFTNTFDTLMNYVAKPVQADYSPLNSSSVPQLPNSEYTVKPGDTLWDIAQNKLGDGNKWNLLQGYGGQPTQLPIGQKITIPTSSQPQQNYSPQQPNTSTNNGPVYSPPPAQQMASYVQNIPKQNPQAFERPATKSGLKLDFTPGRSVSPLQQYSGPSSPAIPKANISKSLSGALGSFKQYGY